MLDIMVDTFIIPPTTRMAENEQRRTENAMLKQQAVATQKALISGAFCYWLFTEIKHGLSLSSAH